jgi:hypothetical protein
MGRRLVDQGPRKIGRPRDPHSLGQRPLQPTRPGQAIREQQTDRPQRHPFVLPIGAVAIEPVGPQRRSLGDGADPHRRVELGERHHHRAASQLLRRLHPPPRSLAEDLGVEPPSRAQSGQHHPSRRESAVGLENEGLLGLAPKPLLAGGAE